MTVDEIVRLTMDECIILLPKDAVIGRKFFMPTIQTEKQLFDFCGGKKND